MTIEPPPRSAMDGTQARVQSRGAVHVHVHEVLVVVPVDVHQPRELHVAEDGCVVHQEVDAAERGDGGLRHRLRRLGRADVGRDEDRLAPGVHDLARDAVARVLGDLGHHDLRALLGEPLGVGLADAAARSGHDRDLALDAVVLHCGSSFQTFTGSFEKPRTFTECTRSMPSLWTS